MYTTIDLYDNRYISNHVAQNHSVKRFLTDNLERKMNLCYEFFSEMAQIQLNDPFPLQESSLSDQTSLLEEMRPPDPSLSLRSDEQSSVSLTPDSPGHSVSPSPSLSTSHRSETRHSISLSPPRATGCFCDKIIPLYTLSNVNVRPFLPPSFSM